MEMAGLLEVSWYFRCRYDSWHRGQHNQQELRLTLSQDENKSSSWCEKCEAFSQLAAAVHPASIHRIRRYPTCPKISDTFSLQRLQKLGFWRATMASPWVSPQFEASRSACPSFEKIGGQFQNHLQLEWSISGTWMRISGFLVWLISAIFIYITLPLRMMLAIKQDVNQAGIILRMPPTK